MSVMAIRGAIQVEGNESGSIIAGTSRLVTTVMSVNGLGAWDIVSMLFTMTPDLTAAFPAAAARELGLTDVPLICATEVDVPGALPRVIRLMAHVDIDAHRGEIQHVYLGGAEALRPDLSAPRAVVRQAAEVVVRRRPRLQLVGWSGFRYG
jgi:chorismate mutase